MNEYDYRGYVITEVPEGYYIVHGATFPSYDEACDWIDDELDYPSLSTKPIVIPELRTYHISYVTKSYDRGYDEYIQAYSEEEAIKHLKHWHRDIAYIADVYEVE
jgi:hypothetical protein